MLGVAELNAVEQLPFDPVFHEFSQAFQKCVSQVANSLLLLTEHTVTQRNREKTFNKHFKSKGHFCGNRRGAIFPPASVGKGWQGEKGLFLLGELCP